MVEDIKFQLWKQLRKKHYVDKGNKKQFTPADIGILKVLGELLSYTIKKISNSASFLFYSFIVS